MLLDADESSKTVLGPGPEILNFQTKASARWKRRWTGWRTLVMSVKRCSCVDALGARNASTGARADRTENPVLARYAVQELLTPNESVQGRPIRAETSHARLLQC